MKIWIVWLPNIWKSTLFNALTKNYSADAQNFPFCTIEPNIWIVNIKDKRVDKLAELSKSKKKIYSTIEFVDIAWLVKWAWQWEWLWNKFLSHIREVDAIVQVLRYFKDENVTHVEWEINPEKDLEIINNELIFSDIEQLEKKIPGLEKKAKLTNDKKQKKENEILKKIYNSLLKWEMAINCELTDEEKIIIKWYNLLTMKPIIYAINIWQDDIKNSQNIKKDLQNKIKWPIEIVCAKLESELLDLEEKEKKDFIKDLLEIENINNIPTLDNIIKLAFNKVWLMYFFTTWEKETKARTIKNDTKAPQAWWVIHSDIERWFIKAEIVKYEDLIKQWSRTKAKENWLLKTEWKNYIINDWDVIYFKFNV